MKKRIEVIMAILLLLGACFFAREGVSVVDNLKVQTGQVCVVIDAGHGGDRLRKTKKISNIQSDLSCICINQTECYIMYI